MAAVGLPPSCIFTCSAPNSANSKGGRIASFGCTNAHAMCLRRHNLAIAQAWQGASCHTPGHY